MRAYFSVNAVVTKSCSQSSSSLIIPAMCRNLNSIMFVWSSITMSWKAYELRNSVLKTTSNCLKLRRYKYSRSWSHCLTSSSAICDLGFEGLDDRIVMASWLGEKFCYDSLTPRMPCSISPVLRSVTSSSLTFSGQFR